MPVLLGALSSLLIGISDTLGRSVTRRANAVTHVATAMLGGVVLAIVAASVSRHDLIGADLARGAVSGLFMAAALAVMYRGMARSSAAVTSPVVAVFVGLIPLTWDVARGVDLSGRAAAGCAVALVSLIFTTFNPDLGDRVKTGLVHGLASGVMFGVALITVGETAEASGAWPVALQRLVGFLAMVIVADRMAVPVFPTRRLLPLSIVSGVVGTAGIVAFILGAQRGDVGVVSVAASLFPAVVAILSKWFDDDQLRWWQGVGIAGSIVGLSLIALG